MAKTRTSGARFVGFADPNVTKIELYRGRTTKNPLHLNDRNVSKTLMHGKRAKTKEITEKIFDTYNKSAAGKFLHAHGIPKIIMTLGSVKHRFSKSNISREALSFVSNHERLNYLLSHGTVLEYPVKRTSSSGNEKGYKKKWEHFWKVKGRVIVGAKDKRFSISVAQNKGENTAFIYDIMIY